MSKIQFSVLIFLFTVVKSAVAGPFGLEQGMRLSQLGAKAEQVAPDKYKLLTVPKPHSAFESYIVQVGQTAGLCWIKAVGKNISTNSYGFKIKTAYTEMKEKLVSNYGEPSTDIDQLLPGSIWNEPNDWTMGLVKKERYLFAVWERKKGAKLPSELKPVGVFATGLRSDTAYIQVEYTFSNEDACDGEIKKAEDSAL